jgi:hypothetical protein
MFKSKGRISALLLVVLFSANIAAAAPRRDTGETGVFAKLIHLVKKLLPSPADEPTFPRP